MILCTIKPASLYEQILRDGYYRFDENKAGEAFKEDFQAAYDWLAEEMIKRSGGIYRVKAVGRAAFFVLTVREKYVIIFYIFNV